MKRFSVTSSLIAIVALCVMTSPSHADGEGGVRKLQKSMADKYRQKQPLENPYFSSATISGFSWSQVDSNGRVTSQSKVSGSATGNASVFGRANGNASSTVARNGRDEKSNATSSAQLRIDGFTARSMVLPPPPLRLGVPLKLPNPFLHKRVPENGVTPSQRN